MAKKGVKRDGSKSKAIADYMAANAGATAKDVVSGLKAQGVQVSLGLVNKVKYSKPGKKGGAAKRGRPRSGGTNASDVIRDYMDKNPSATRPEIRDALKAQGVKASGSLISAVYYKYRSAKGQPVVAASRGGARRKAKAYGRRPATSQAGSELSASELISAKGMVDQLGGINKVREALDLLEQLS